LRASCRSELNRPPSGSALSVASEIRTGVSLISRPPEGHPAQNTEAAICTNTSAEQSPPDGSTVHGED